MPTGGLIAGIGDFGVEALVTQAEQAKSNAESSAGIATTKAGEANTSATNALNAANEASTSASTATAKAGIATTKAGEANTSASNASTSESNALNYKNSAVSAANTATTKANEAQQSAWNAQSSADSASSSKNATSEYVAQFSSLVSDNKIIKRYTIAELRLLSPNISDPNNTFFSTDAGKEGLWKIKAGSSEADNLGTILVCANGVRLERVCDYIKPEWFGAIGDGTVDDTQAIQNALNVGSVVLGSKAYYIAGVLTIPTGRSLTGTNWYRDDISGSKIYIKNLVGRIEMLEKTKISSISFVFPNQNWTNFVQYATTITARTSSEISQINYLGGWRAIETNGNYNCEKVNISQIYGYPLSVGIDLKFCADVPRINEVHFNPNSLRPVMGEQALLDVCAIAKQSNTAVKIGHVDDVHMNSIFAWGFKTFIHTYITTSGVSGDFQLVNWGADIVNTVFLLERINSAFGIHVTNGWATPLNYVAGSEQALVRITGNLSGCCIKLSNVYCTGWIPAEAETPNNKGLNYYFVNQSTGTANHVLVSNYQLETAKVATSVGFSDANNSSCQLVNGIQPLTNGGGFAKVRPNLLYARKNTTGTSPIVQIENSITEKIFEVNSNGDGSNTAVGNSAGISLTTGHTNSLFGNSAGGSLTTGIINSFFGVGAGLFTTTGSFNAFFGVNAGRNNTTGEQNTFIGFESGYYNSIGAKNVFLGRSAGKFSADGVTQNGNSTNSVFLGNSTKSGSVNQDQEIVIGYEAIGDGSNTTVIGNANNKSVKLNGKIKLNTGTNASIGNATLINGVVTITTTAVTTNSFVFPVTKTIVGSAAYTYTYDVSTAGTLIITARQANGNVETGCNSVITYWIAN